MVYMLQAVSHVAITLVAVVGMALRIEHRLTKIETDIGWLKANQRCKEKGDCKNETDGDVGKA